MIVGSLSILHFLFTSCNKKGAPAASACESMCVWCQKEPWDNSVPQELPDTSPGHIPAIKPHRALSNACAVQTPSPACRHGFCFTVFIQTHTPASYHFRLSGKTVFFVLSLLRQIIPKHQVPCITWWRLLYWETAASCSRTAVVSYSLSRKKKNVVNSTSRVFEVLEKTINLITLEGWCEISHEIWALVIKNKNCIY